MNDHLNNLRRVQGVTHNIFFKLRVYLDSHDDQAQVFAIRDLIIASEWSKLGSLCGLEQEALARVSALLPDDLPKEEKETLNKLGTNTENPIGASAYCRMLLIASQRFNAAVPGEGFGQVTQRLEIGKLLLDLRGLLETIGDAVDDGGMHIAYSQVLLLITLCYLIEYPWSIALEFQYWTIFGTCIQFISVGGVYWVSSEMFKPYGGFVQINMKSFFVEIESGWPRWAKCVDDIDINED
jgi:hypothetical protein